MRFESSLPPTPNKTNRYQWLQPLLLFGFALCFFVSILALVALWWLSSDIVPQTSTQPLQIESEQVLPELALMHLAGDPVDALVNQALYAGEYATSHALLTFGINDMPATRVALLLQLAQLFQERKQLALATQLLHNSRAVAILDTQLDPLVRADALLQCAARFLALELPAEAADSAVQVKRIVEQTPELLPAERNQLLQALLPLTAQLDDELLHQQVQELARSPYLSPGGIIIERDLHLTEGSVEFNSELTEIIRERQQLSRQLAEYLIQSPAVDSTPFTDALASALRKEDEQRTLYFTQILTSQNLTFSLQFWSLHEQRNWLLLKLAVAHRAFGLSLVPDWEAEKSLIAEELGLVTEQMQAALSKVPESQSAILDQLLQRIVALRWLALQTELGFAPQRKAADIGEQLRIAQEELAVHGTKAALPLIYQSDAIPPGYRIDQSR